MESLLFTTWSQPSSATGDQTSSLIASHAHLTVVHSLLAARAVQYKSSNLLAPRESHFHLFTGLMPMRKAFKGSRLAAIVSALPISTDPNTAYGSLPC